MTKEIIENDPYKLAGVDIDAGNSLVDKIKKSVAASHNKNVLDNIGGFAGMYELDKDTYPPPPPRAPGHAAAPAPPVSRFQSFQNMPPSPGRA